MSKHPSKKLPFGPEKQKQLDAVVRKLAQGAKAAVEAELEKRLTYCDEGEVQWHAYARFLLSSGHTIYVNLRTMEGTVSAKPNARAQKQVAKREAKAKARKERASKKEVPN